MDPHRPCQVLARAPVLTWMSDPEGRVVFLSAHWAEVTGRSVPELLAGGLAEVIHPDDREQALGTLLGLGRSGARIVREYRIRRADGAWRWILDTAIAGHDERGGASGRVGVCEDVTERHEFLALVRFQRAISSCLAQARTHPGFLPGLLRTICVDGGFEEASLCRVSAGGAPTRLVMRHPRSTADAGECSCWRASRVGTQTFQPPCSQSGVPIVGSYPLVVGETVTGLLTLCSRKGADVFLPLLESLHGTAAVLGAILDLEHVEERLRTSEERYRALVEQSSDGIYLFDPATHQVLEANRRFLQMTGYAREEVPSLTLEDLVVDDAVGIATCVSQVVNDTETLARQQDYRAKAGTVVPVESSASLVRWGRESAVLVNLRDVSEQQAAARALEALTRRLQLILDGAGEGILGLDARGRVTFVNPSAAAYLGWSAAELEGRPAHATWHHTRKDGSDHPASDCPILETIRTGRRVEVGEDVFCRRDGTRFLAEYVATPLREGGELAGAVVLFRDVSKEARLESIAAALETTNSIGLVFSTVRHELGNPVNSVKMALSVLRNNLGRLEPDAALAYVERSLAELGRVEELLASLKTYSLYEDVRLRDQELGAFVGELGRFVRADLAARGVEMEVGSGAEDVVVRADPRALRQVVINLVANAAEAMAESGGRVRLFVFSEEGWGGIGVEDNGPGMSPETVRSLFLPFYTTKPAGSGLGLVIARKMMTRMGGTIEVMSEPLRGTTMLLSLRKAEGTA